VAGKKPILEPSTWSCFYQGRVLGAFCRKDGYQAPIWMGQYGIPRAMDGRWRGNVGVKPWNQNLLSTGARVRLWLRVVEVTESATGDSCWCVFGFFKGSPECTIARSHDGVMETMATKALRSVWTATLLRGKVDAQIYSNLRAAAKKVNQFE